MNEMDEKELFGSDIKLVEIVPGKFDFAITKNGDFEEVSGRNYIKQRIVNVLFTRCRFYPPQIPELISVNEILKRNVDDAGLHFFPGDLENLGYSDYGSLLSYLIGEPDTPEIKILISLYISKAIALEYNNGVDKIINLEVQKIDIGIYRIFIEIGLINNKTIKIEENLLGV